MMTLVSRMALLAVLLGLPTGTALAQTCARLFVPTGIGLDCRVVPGTEGGGWQLVVAPTNGALAAFTQLSVQPVEMPIAEPSQWLRDRVRLGLDDVEDAVREILDSPDNPLAGSRLNAQLEVWLQMAALLDDYPLSGCSEPAPMRAEGSHEMRCHWGVANVEKRLSLRLVERAGSRYYVVIRAMTERRMRHLLAIANSF
jgi:hypothetical protein